LRALFSFLSFLVEFKMRNCTDISIVDGDFQQTFILRISRFNIVQNILEYQNTQSIHP